MMHRTCYRIFFLLVIMIVTRHGGNAGTPWFVSYEKALEAQERGDWQASVKFLTDALAENATPKLKAKTYGMRFINYFPFYRMGVAYYNLHDAGKALEFLARSEKIGELTGAEEEYGSLIHIKEVLTGKRQFPPKSVAAADPPRRDSVYRDRGASEETFPWYVSYETGLAYIESGDWVKAIENLKWALASNNHPRQYARTYGMWFISYHPYYYLGAAYYNQTLWDFAVKYLETSLHLEEFDQEGTEFKERQSLLASARASSSKKQTRPVSEELRETLTLELSEAITLFNNEEYAEAESRFRSILHLDPYNSVAKSYLKKMSGKTKPEATPGNDYMAGVFEYFKGNFAKSIELFTSALEENDRDPNLHAYLGAAYASKYLAGGKKDHATLKNAEQSFGKTLTLNGQYTMDSRIFSGDVLKIFQGVKKGVRK